MVVGTRLDCYRSNLRAYNYFSGIEFPTPVKQLDRVEALNPTISINVLSHDVDDQVIVPLRISREKERRHNITLFFDSNENGSHYSLVRNVR